MAITLLFFMNIVKPSQGCKSKLFLTSFGMTICHFCQMVQVQHIFKLWFSIYFFIKY